MGILDSVDGTIEDLHVLLVQKPKRKRSRVETGKRAKD